jgi:TusA-related sulfurtransferase
MSDATIVDARGLSCPEPVIRTRKALTSVTGGRVDILVDTVTARENVSRYARSQGWTAEARDEGDHFVVSLKK